MGVRTLTFGKEDETREDDLPTFDETALRILNLLFALDAAQGPLTTEQIVSDSDLGYGSDNRASDCRKFKRDRERLEEHGIVVREVRANGTAENEESSWEIDRGRTHADRGTLSADDAGVVLAAIDETFELHADNPERWPLQRARLKLRELAGAHGETPVAGEAVAFSPTLQTVWAAFTERRPARFTYQDAKGVEKDREVEVYGSFSQGNRSYIVGFDRDAHGMRTFRTDRILRARHAPAAAGTYRIPSQFDVEDYQFLPFDFSDRQPVEAAFVFSGEVGKHELELLTRGRGTLVRNNSSDDAGKTWTWTVEVRDMRAAALFSLEHASLGMRPVSPEELLGHWRAAIEQSILAHDGR